MTNERTAWQEAMGANPEKMEPIYRVKVILEQIIAMTKAQRGKMEAMDVKANPEEDMESEVEHRKIAKEDTAGKPAKGRKKRHKARKIAAGRRGEQMEMTREDCGSRRNLAAACNNVSRCARVA
jgi:hypothetical protein